jgi:predicted ester cyclase
MVPQNLVAGPTSKEVNMIDEFVERFVQVGESSIAARDWEAYGSVFAEDLLMVTSALPGPTRGRDARLQFVQGIMNSFPDGVVKIQRHFSKGDWACVEVLFTGTHTGPMPGPGGTEIPPTNKPVKWPYCMVMKFKDGLVSELYEYYDQVGLLAQLGLM